MTKKIIIADDNSIFRSALGSLISGNGLEIVAEAKDGLETVEIVEGEPPDLLLLDINMPGMNGIDVLKKLRKSLPELKIIIVTMHSHYMQEALEAGADGYCVKDCQPAELKKGVHKVLNGEDFVLTD